MTTVPQPSAWAEQEAARPLPPYLSVVDAAASADALPAREVLSGLLQAVALHADRQAFAALFKHFAPRVKAYLMRLGTSEGVAEELAQEALICVWRKAPTYDIAHAGVSTWIFTIARNLRIDHLRRKGHALTTDAEPSADDVQPDDAPAPEECASARQREQHVRQALRQLPPEQAQVLRLSFFDEHPHAQIALELGIPLGTVKSRVRLAVNHLRRLLGALAP